MNLRPVALALSALGARWRLDLTDRIGLTDCTDPTDPTDPTGPTGLVGLVGLADRTDLTRARRRPVRAQCRRRCHHGHLAAPGPGGGASGHLLLTGRVSWKAVPLHELGHVMGLDHAGTSRQLMYPVLPANLTDLQAGDLTGLSRLGRSAGCVVMPGLG